MALQTTGNSVGCSTARFKIPHYWPCGRGTHYDDVIMSAMASQISSTSSRMFRRTSKKTSKLRVTGLCDGNHRWPVDSLRKGPVTRKVFPFDDVIMTRASNAELISIFRRYYVHVPATGTNKLQDANLVLLVHKKSVLASLADKCLFNSLLSLTAKKYSKLCI